jgi:hypothetical protein
VCESKRAVERSKGIVKLSGLPKTPVPLFIADLECGNVYYNVM